MTTWKLGKKSDIHLELTSSCQAKCPHCSRIFDFNPKVPGSFKVDSWDIEELKKVFPPPLLQDIRSFLLCGNSGDPLAFPDIAEFISYLRSHNPNLKISIHTNGGLGNQRTWEKLGGLLQSRDFFLTFSIDGLKDTNHLYRIGVQWQKIMENAKTFIDSGGFAAWKFLSFKHSRHQVADAERLARSMGFKLFYVKEPHPGTHSIDFEKSTNETFELEDLSHRSDKEIENMALEEVSGAIENFSTLEDVKISCKVFEARSIYVDSHKMVWPCCWIGNVGLMRKGGVLREEFSRKMESLGFEKNFNHLSYNSLDKILQSPFFEHILPESWSKKNVDSFRCFGTCLQTCGQSYRRPD